MVGGVGAVQADVPLVVLLLNVEVIRQNPVGAKVGPLLSGVPQWSEALEGTQVDPVRDADWVLITGPGLIYTEKDAIIIRYNASEAVANAAVAAVRKRSHNGADFDAGVPGVKATLAHADHFPRVLLQPQPHILAIVPPYYANTAAKLLSKQKVSAHVRPGEALRLTLQNPHKPMPVFPEAITELQAWIVPRADGGADIFADGRCKDAAAAEESADALASFHKRYMQSLEGVGANIATHGLLRGVDVKTEGSVVKIRVPASRDQLEAILNLAAIQLGVALPGAAGSASAGPAPLPRAPGSGNAPR
jgi:hypothetical protein